MRYEELLEAAPLDIHKGVRYYHGTGSKEAALAIWKKGLDPAATEVKYGESKPHMRPVAGRVYLAQNVGYATVYAIGGDFLGSTVPKGWEKNIGYVFVFDGSDLQDIQPDEDSVGEFVAHCLNRDQKYVQEKYPEIINSPDVKEVTRRAGYNLSASTLRKVRDGEYSSWARAGKAILKDMNDREKLAFIDLGAHVAHGGGNLIPREMWAIPAKYSQKLVKDGSNFFEVAKLLKKRY
jgi:hypothetical protein